MPFGTIQIHYVEKPQPKIREPKIKKPKAQKPENLQPEAKMPEIQQPVEATTRSAGLPLGAGLQRMEFLVVAPSAVEAADFVCSAYFNMVHMTSGSPISVYTRDFQTISRFTERKQDIEASIMKYPGTEVHLCTQDVEGLNDVTVTISQSGNQALSLDLHFQCAAYGASCGADAVFVILRPNDPHNAEVIAGVSSAQQVFYVFSGLESKTVFIENAAVSPLKADFLSRLTEGLGIPRRKDSFAAYVQIYGGLLFDRWENETLICRTNAKCREYTPIGCHIPVFTIITDVADRLTDADENTPIQALYNIIRDCFLKKEPAHLSWCNSTEEVCKE